jgi:DNA-directed RNA polymerase specialized sigma24 family protein
VSGVALTIEQVIEEYGYYVESLLLQYGVKPDDFEDLKQEVWLRVHASEMLENHREGAAKISTRLWYVIRAVVKNARYHAMAKGRGLAVPWPKKDGHMGDHGRMARGIERTVILKDLVRKLDHRSGMVLAMTCAGARPPQIARRIHQSEQTVRNICRRLEQGEGAVA